MSTEEKPSTTDLDAVATVLRRIEAKLDRLLDVSSSPAPPGGRPRDTTPPVHFTNAQWAVTSFGLEHLGGEGAYAVEGQRMCEMLGDLYDWPLHMAGKPWVDVEAFLEAFEHALQRFCPGDFDADRLARSAAKARAAKARQVGGHR
jgi:hypothetical protein